MQSIGREIKQKVRMKSSVGVGGGVGLVREGFTGKEHLSRELTAMRSELYLEEEQAVLWRPAARSGSSSFRKSRRPVWLLRMGKARINRKGGREEMEERQRTLPGKDVSFTWAKWKPQKLATPCERFCGIPSLNFIMFIICITLHTKMLQNVWFSASQSPSLVICFSYYV